jgi:hypothetical protein
MTINKAQGQTLQRVGVYLPKPVFCHGQLYVAFSWCDSRRGVRVLVQGGSRAALNGALLAFTPVMWSIARCCSDSSCGYGVLWGLLWTPSFFSGLGLWFCPRGWVGLNCIGAFIYIKHSLHRISGLGLWFRPRGWVGLDCIGAFIYIRHFLHRISRHVMDFK